MLDRSLRQTKTRLLRPTAARLATVPPLALTATGLGFGLGAAALAGTGSWALALAAWLANRLFDGLDGEVARLTGSDSDLGGYLDLTADAVAYAALPVGVAAGVGTAAAWTAAAVLLATFYANVVSVTMLSAVLEKRRAGADAAGDDRTVTLPAGLIEGTETIVLFAALLVFPGAAVWLMAAMAGLVMITAVGRVAGAWSLLVTSPVSPGGPVGPDDESVADR
ncbi:MAG: CDP-alcohol phosphatidyltransferase family protein [Actinomycetota bacterium]